MAIGPSRWIAGVACVVALLASASMVAAQPAWKIGTVVAPPSVLGVIVDEIAAKIGAATSDRVKAERLQNPNEQEITQNIIRGRIEMGYISATGMAVAVPEASVLNLAFLWASEDEKNHVTDKFVVPLLDDILDRRGLAMVSFAEAGWTNLFCKTACTKPEDLKGMKMRVSPTASDKMMFERLGANGVTTSLADFWPGLQQGVFNGGTLTFAFYLITPAAQAAPHYVFTRHSHQPAILIAHKATWEKVAAADRAAIKAAMPPANALRKRVLDNEEPRKADHRGKGGFIHELTPAQRAEWAKVIVPGHESVLPSYGERGKELYEAIQKGKAEFAAAKK
jgi:TRAP-type C4-dicarboxylate transport system substrate-binding protein